MKYYVVDAFAETVFTGNPTGVCLVDETAWPDDALLLAIAAEINLPETAYVMKGETATPCGGLHPMRK
jgi:predicted PhzF superfamily epimerase YddE/YHI9